MSSILVIRKFFFVRFENVICTIILGVKYKLLCGTTTESKFVMNENVFNSNLKNKKFQIFKQILSKSRIFLNT